MSVDPTAAVARAKLSIWGLCALAALLVAAIWGAHYVFAAGHAPPWSPRQINFWIFVAAAALTGAAAIPALAGRKDIGRGLVTIAALCAVLTGAGLMLEKSSGWLFAAGVFLNLGVIWTILIVRNVVRRRRVQIVVYLSEFLLDAHRDDGAPIEPASLRLALEKYLFESDGWFLVENNEDFLRHLKERREDAINLSKALAANDAPRISELREKISYEDIAELLTRARGFVKGQEPLVRQMRAFLNWLPSYLPFAVLAGFFFIQIAPPTVDLLSSMGLCTACAGHGWGLFWSADQSVKDQPPAALIIATFAFAGAYLHALTAFVSGTVNYDIGPPSFIRAFRHAVAAIAVSVVSWYAVNSVQITFPNTAAQTETPTAPAPQPAAPQLPLAFLVVAFVLGFYPDLGMAELVRRTNLFGLKQRNDRLAIQTLSTPLELLDGVDYDIRLRLEEFGVVDMQNLATANPILLFAETPMFGLYQSIDWIAQAQLCLAVGPECFVKLRDWKLRTIFDLERALRDCHSPDALKIAIAREIFEGTNRAEIIKTALKFDDPVEGLKSAEAIGHIVMDDLHVRRLRQIWKIIIARLGGEWSETLFPRTADCPGAAAPTPCCAKCVCPACAAQSKQAAEEIRSDEAVDAQTESEADAQAVEQQDAAAKPPPAADTPENKER